MTCSTGLAFTTTSVFATLNHQKIHVTETTPIPTPSPRNLTCKARSQQEHFTETKSNICISIHEERFVPAELLQVRFRFALTWK